MYFDLRAYYEIRKIKILCKQFCKFGPCLYHTADQIRLLTVQSSNFEAVKATRRTQTYLNSSFEILLIACKRRMHFIREDICRIVQDKVIMLLELQVVGSLAIGYHRLKRFKDKPM